MKRRKTEIPSAVVLPPTALKEKDAACYIGMSVPFLRTSRCRGNLPSQTPAPPYVKIGRAVLYLVSDLDAWLDENRVEFRKAAGA